MNLFISCVVSIQPMYFAYSIPSMVRRLWRADIQESKYLIWQILMFMVTRPIKFHRPLIVFDMILVSKYNFAAFVCRRHCFLLAFHMLMFMHISRGFDWNQTQRDLTQSTVIAIWIDTKHHIWMHFPSNKKLTYNNAVNIQPYSNAISLFMWNWTTFWRDVFRLLLFFQTSYVAMKKLFVF